MSLYTAAFTHNVGDLRVDLTLLDSISKSIAIEESAPNVELPALQSGSFTLVMNLYYFRNKKQFLINFVGLVNERR